ncbi:MAG: hypothetical protein ABSH04_07750 [Acidimicrobiales bacterium]
MIAFGACMTLALAGCSGSGRPNKTSSRTSTIASTTTSAGGASSTSSTEHNTTTSAISPQVNGPLTVCTYDGSSPGPVFIRFETGENASTFAAGKQQFEQTGGRITDLPGLGDAAYSSTQGSGESQSNTIAVLKGGIELLVTAPVSLDDVDALARQILPSI